METNKVRSLRSRIILQFAIILMPIILSVIYESFTEAQQVSRLRSSLEVATAATEAKDNYKTFVDAVVEAVDTGSLSDRGRTALQATRSTLLTLKASDPGFDVKPIAEDVEHLLHATELGTTVPTLLPLRSTINRVSERLATLVEHARVTEQGVIAGVAASAERQVGILLIAALISLLSAAYFVVVIIRGLTQPLDRAVTLARSFAGGDFIEGENVDVSNDIGGLLHSLDAMRKSLSRAFRDLSKGEARIAHAQRIAQLGDWELDLREQRIVWSEEAARIFGRAPERMPGPEIFTEALVHPNDWPAVERHLHAALTQGLGFNIDFDIVLPNGETRAVNSQTVVLHDEAAGTRLLAGTVQDITLRKEAEDRIRHLALHDSLTGLPNRQLFQENVEQSIALARRNSLLLAILFIDLDRFKIVNDTLGHSVGDELLKQAALRMQQCLRETDTVTRVPDMQLDVVARQGGDEFAIMLTNLTQSDQAARVGQRLLAALARPFALGGQEISISASIGISIYPIDGSDVVTLMKHADAAMYHAKERGKNNFQFFLPSMNQAVLSKLALERELRRALAENQFVLFYQPQVDLATGAIIGCEALIRWQHPERGMVMPLEFIPLAEECGLITPIGEWVLRTACRHGSQWRKAGFTQLTLSINWASQNFNQKNSIELVKQVLAGSGFAAGQLELEMTEGSVMQDTENVIALLHQLKALGVKLSIDDFGTGFSSLNYLKRFPIDTLKIDRAFVSGIPERPEDIAITTAIISFAQALHLNVVAEGVETEAQAEFLRAHACDCAQGYLYSRPVPQEEMTRLLLQGAALPQA